MSLPKQILNDHIWLNLYKEPVNKLGLFLEEKASDKGYVIAIGKACSEDIKEELSIGDLITFEPHHLHKIVVDNETYFSIKESNCLAIVDVNVKTEELPEVDRYIGNF